MQAGEGKREKAACLKREAMRAQIPLDTTPFGGEKTRLVDIDAIPPAVAMKRVAERVALVMRRDFRIAREHLRQKFRPAPSGANCKSDPGHSLPPSCKLSRIPGTNMGAAVSFR